MLTTGCVYGRSLPLPVLMLSVAVSLSQNAFGRVVGQFDESEVGAHYRTEHGPGSPAGQPRLGWWMRRMLSSTLNIR